MTEIPTEALEAAARALYNLRRQPGADWWAIDGWAGTPGGKLDLRRAAARTEATAILQAAAPYLIAEGRRQRDAELFAPALRDYQPDERPKLMARYERELRAKIADEIRAVAAVYLMRANEDDSLTGRTVLNVKAEAVEHAARVAEGLGPAERAERQLRESRERQAGLDMERIERARKAQREGGS